MASRTENSTRNLVFAVSGHILLILLTFISRTVFIRTLGSTYLGINGLFANIISFLNLAELGLGSAIAFSLYKPIKDNDTARIASIMQFYKKALDVISHGAPLVKISALTVREDIVRIKTTVPNDQLEKIAAVSQHLNEQFDGLEKLYRKVDIR